MKELFGGLLPIFENNVHEGQQKWLQKPRGRKKETPLRDANGNGWKNKPAVWQIGSIAKIIFPLMRVAAAPLSFKAPENVGAWKGHTTMTSTVELFTQDHKVNTTSSGFC